MRDYTLANVYGTHMPIRLHLEKQYLSSIQRPPHLKSHMIALETLLNKDFDLDFADYLNGMQPLLALTDPDRSLYERRSET